MSNVNAYMRRQGFGDYRRADHATREDMELAALEYAAQEQRRPSVFHEIGARRARERYESDRATAQDLRALADDGAISAAQIADYYRRHGWTPPKR